VVGVRELLDHEAAGGLLDHEGAGEFLDHGGRGDTTLELGGGAIHPSAFSNSSVFTVFNPPPSNTLTPPSPPPSNSWCHPGGGG